MFYYQPYQPPPTLAELDAAIKRAAQKQVEFERKFGAYYKPRFSQPGRSK